MNATEDHNGHPLQPGSPSAATQPFNRFKTSGEFTDVLDRLSALAGELRQQALNNPKRDGHLLDLAYRLDTLASEGKTK